MVRQRLLTWITKIATVDKDEEIEKLMRRHTINYYRTKSPAATAVMKAQEALVALVAPNASGNDDAVAEAQRALAEAKRDFFDKGEERDFFDNCWEDEPQRPQLQRVVSQLATITTLTRRRWFCSSSESPKSSPGAVHHLGEPSIAIHKARNQDNRKDGTTIAKPGERELAATNPTALLSEYQALEVAPADRSHPTGATIHPE